MLRVMFRPAPPMLFIWFELDQPFCLNLPLRRIAGRKRCLGNWKCLFLPVIPRPGGSISILQCRRRSADGNRNVYCVCSLWKRRTHVDPFRSIYISSSHCSKPTELVMVLARRLDGYDANHFFFIICFLKHENTKFVLEVKYNIETHIFVSLVDRSANFMYFSECIETF